MTFQEIEFALKVNGVDKEDMQTLMEYCRTKGSKGTDYSKLDDMLVDMGYSRVFTDEFFGWAGDEDEDFEDNYDDEYYSIEKIHHKHKWDE